jgi:hypothetical protein
MTLIIANSSEIYADRMVCAGNRVLKPEAKIKTLKNIIYASAGNCVEGDIAMMYLDEFIINREGLEKAPPNQVLFEFKVFFYELYKKVSDLDKNDFVVYYNGLAFFVESLDVVFLEDEYVFLGSGAVWGQALYRAKTPIKEIFEIVPEFMNNCSKEYDYLKI